MNSDIASLLLLIDVFSFFFWEKSNPRIEYNSLGSVRTNPVFAHTVLRADKSLSKPFSPFSDVSQRALDVNAFREKPQVSHFPKHPPPSQLLSCQANVCMGWERRFHILSHMNICLRSV